LAFEFCEEDLAEARRMNRLLARIPRLQLLTPWDVAIFNGAIWLSQLIPAPIKPEVLVEGATIESDGHTARVRILRPDGPCKGVYLDIHGGAWVLGNARMDDKLNAEIVRDCGFAVVSVDYRLATKNVMQTVLEDCEAAASWLLDNARAEFGCEQIFFGGESAGAHLVVSTLLRLRERGRSLDKVAGLVLFYGPYDLAGSESLRAAGPQTLVLHGPTLMSSLDALLPGMSEEERRHPEISPLYADLAGLPPALFIVGELDPLLDDSVLMSGRWNAANGNAELVVVPHAPHAFNRLPTALARKTNAFMHTWVTWQLSAHHPAQPVRLRKKEGPDRSGPLDQWLKPRARRAKAPAVAPA
jgi:acetyl esterase/lipase